MLSPVSLAGIERFNTWHCLCTLRAGHRACSLAGRRIAHVDCSSYDAQFVLDGSAVIGAVSAWTPEIALLDINMPIMDGFAVAQQLRQHDVTKHIVIVAFTGQDEWTVRAAGIAAGFDGYCKKGIAPASLLLLLEQLAN
ncbi:response regulator [Caballeronia sp. EK]|uniref:response regulator n=1 Tax=Caballeronia sp. EK TaxID=2767469 RepID=UPI0016551461|nr:response regulator [Caballeronia sp. EK]MBC8642891.1 response regulator [Caballeronia sp. EK]